MELKGAGEVSAALQFAEGKLGVAWTRLQALDSRHHAEKAARAQAEAARAQGEAAARREHNLLA